MFAKSCENNFCIFWEDDKCTLDSISLDLQAVCLDSIFVKLDEQLLSNARKEMREKLERQFNRR